MYVGKESESWTEVPILGALLHKMMAEGGGRAHQVVQEDQSSLGTAHRERESQKRQVFLLKDSQLHLSEFEHGNKP